MPFFVVYYESMELEHLPRNYLQLFFLPSGHFVFFFQRALCCGRRTMLDVAEHVLAHLDGEQVFVHVS